MASHSLDNQRLGATLNGNICSNLSEWILNTCNRDYQKLDPSALINKFLSMANKQQLTGQQNYQLFNYAHQATTTTLANNQNSSTAGSFLDQLVATNSVSLGPLDEASNEGNLLPLTKLVRNHLIGPMQSIEEKLDYYFNDIWLNSGDERTSKLPFMGAGPWKLIYATLIYLTLIKWLLPKLMRPIEAFELNWPIRIYNLSMVLSNIWAFYHGTILLNFGAKCFGCEVINHRDYSPQAIELLHYGWLFFISRLIEWLDTIFFVLRKKDRQITKLHVFHHSFVPLISWTYLKYHPGATVAFFPLVNTFVHSIMYTYYLLATFGPVIQPYLWWKRYLTSLQIAQFVLILIQLASIPLTGNEKCQYPRGFLYVAFAGAILFLWLFYTYYIDTYSKQQSQMGAKEDQNKRGSNLVMKTTQKTAGQQNIRKQPSANSQATSENPIMDSLLKTREGTSKALSDLIDNSIVSEDCNGDNLMSKKLV